MKQEYARQAIHLMLGAIYFCILFFLGTEQGIAALIIIFGLGSLASYLIARKKRIPFAKNILEMAERENESHLPGKAGLAFTLGVLITAIIFLPVNRMAAFGGIITLTLGDALSTIIGMKFGKTKTAHNKTLEGTMAGTIAATLGLAVLFPLPIALAAAITGMLAEYLPINDNYTIPLASAAALALLL